MLWNQLFIGYHEELQTFSVCFMLSYSSGDCAFFNSYCHTFQKQKTKYTHLSPFISYILFVHRWHGRLIFALNIIFLGVAPPSFGFISAGVELYVLTTTGDVMSFKSITIVVVSALLSLAPVIFKRQLRAKIE